MNSELEAFFKDTPMGIKSVLRAAVHLAEKVNSRTELSGKEKTDLIVKSLVEFLGEGKPELVALVEAVVPGVLELVISTARGKYMLKQVTSCLPPGLCGHSKLVNPVASLSGEAANLAAKVQDPTNEVSARTANVWAWVRSSLFRPTAPTPVSPVSPVSAVETSPVTTIREPTPGTNA